jgi:hypothetical protein
MRDNGRPNPDRPTPEGLYIIGASRQGADEESIEVEDPATTEVVTREADVTSAGGREALGAATYAQWAWAATFPRLRGEILRAAFDLIRRRADDFELLMTFEMGKPLEQARGEAVCGADFFRWFSEQAIRSHGRNRISPDGDTCLITLRRPMGPVLMITPCNLPLALRPRKIGPTIAAGRTMVAKPSVRRDSPSSRWRTSSTRSAFPQGHSASARRRALVDAFGADRLMWGSDISRIIGKVGFKQMFDPARISRYDAYHSYAEALLFLRESEALGPEEKDWVLGGTARKLLRGQLG